MAPCKRSKEAVIICSVLLLLTISGCERSTLEASAPTETIAASTVHTLQNGMEAPYVQETSQRGAGLKRWILAAACIYATLATVMEDYGRVIRPGAPLAPFWV
jgi:hypothetical protein